MCYVINLGPQRHSNSTCRSSQIRITRRLTIACNFRPWQRKAIKGKSPQRATNSTSLCAAEDALKLDMFPLDDLPPPLRRPRLRPRPNPNPSPRQFAPVASSTTVFAATTFSSATPTSQFTSIVPTPSPSPSTSTTAPPSSSSDLSSSTGPPIPSSPSSGFVFSTLTSSFVSDINGSPTTASPSFLSIPRPYPSICFVRARAPHINVAAPSSVKL